MMAGYQLVGEAYLRFVRVVDAIQVMSGTWTSLLSVQLMDR